MIGLDDNIRDALAETFNIALGDAAAQFAEIVNEEIELSVPHVELVEHHLLVSRIEASNEDGARGDLCRISQNFQSNQGDITTQAILLFPERGSLEIVRRMLGDTVSAESLNELEQDALGEIGNIIINGCMNSLAHIFDREMTGTLPEVHTGVAHDLFGAQALNSLQRDARVGRSQNAVLLARIGMRMASRSISGHVVFMMDLPSLQKSIEQIQRFFGMAVDAA
jgi:chemotaxis protein CheC